LGVILLAILLIAVIALKGYALWCSARRDEKWWFIAILRQKLSLKRRRKSDI
jgi:hypothetical protein